MSNPNETPGRKPPRAEPLQPDKPGSGDDRQGGEIANVDDKTVARQKEQSDAAVKNVREGYD